MLIDLSAAFYIADYDLLTHFLANMSIQGGLKWLTSFLLGWGQRVEIEERVSNKHPLICGVPQRNDLLSSIIQPLPVLFGPDGKVFGDWMLAVH